MWTGADFPRRVRDPAEMVVVAVRDEDRDTAGAAPRHLELQTGGVGAGVHDHGLARRAARADDVAVRPELAQLVAVDDRRHRRG